MLPRVILHTAASLDGRTTNFPLISTSTMRLLHDGTPMLYCSETKRFCQHTDSPALEVPPLEHEQMFIPPDTMPRQLLVIAMTSLKRSTGFFDFADASSFRGNGSWDYMGPQCSHKISGSEIR